MSYCSKCGRELKDGDRFCPGCGAAVSGTNTAGADAKAYAAHVGNTVAEGFNQFNDTADTTSQYTKEDISANTGFAVLSYLSLLVLIPLFGAKESKFARFHANQGLVLLIAEAIWGVVQAMVLTTVKIVTLHSLPFLYGIVSAVFGLANLFFLVLSIIGIVNVAQGKAKELPILGNFHII